MGRMSVEPVFTGVGVALVTLFDTDERLDAPATAALAVQLVETGVRAVVVAGSTGEASALSREERAELVTAVRGAVPAHVPVIAGTGAPSARQACEFTADARDRGADAVLVLSPPRIGDPRPYFDRVADAAATTPVLAYHWPATSPPGIAVRDLGDLPITGCKDSTGDPERMLETLHIWDGALYTGSSAVLSFAGGVGCAGAILSLANAEPERCIAAFDGDAAAQRALTEAHLAARRAFPAGIKRLTNARFGTSTTARMA